MAKVKTTFLPKLWNILCKMARTINACKEWNTIAEIIQNKKEVLEK
jgi:hypothetical protein